MPKPTVVIIDDSDSLRTLVALGLERIGYGVLDEAANATDGIRAVDVHRPDVVVIDREMPGISGAEATLLIRARWPDTTVIGLTGHVTGELEIAGAERVFDKRDLRSFFHWMKQRTT